MWVPGEQGPGAPERPPTIVRATAIAAGQRGCTPVRTACRTALARTAGSPSNGRDLGFPIGGPQYIHRAVANGVLCIMPGGG